MAMALLISVLLLFFFPLRNNAQLPQPPNPGFSVSTRFPPVDFKQWFKSLWGPQNQRLDGETLTVWLNQKSGSGFTSKHAYWAGYVSVEMKLPSGYTAGIDTSIYLTSTRNYADEHDELDFEFLGNIEGKPYVLQTNVLTKQSTEADGYTQGREQQFNLWFDPTADFHRYAILWNPKEIM
ncbi:xyloglucan endotransglucosylase/hydrolase family protein [Striga asiatica]|uniref:Xyloglucan endotransglucosylase/hydrolase family protein n=1 Tax=Striga asiatica TaxID=4170 RepID=A0A5A7QGS1_STRAF|nr:xyloglucan endotransglucosylase/hydrolase family protein [Striga asiatica]